MRWLLVRRLELGSMCGLDCGGYENVTEEKETKWTHGTKALSYQARVQESYRAQGVDRSETAGG